MLFKAPLIDLMPDAIAARFCRDATRRAPWSAVLVSLLCGALTHLLWDAFTHPGTILVDALPMLQTELAVVGGYHVYVFKVLQHGGTLLGLALIALWSINWLRRTPVDSTTRPRALSPAQRVGAQLALAGSPLLAGLCQLSAQCTGDEHGRTAGLRDRLYLYGAACRRVDTCHL